MVERHYYIEPGGRREQLSRKLVLFLRTYEKQAYRSVVDDVFHLFPGAGGVDGYRDGPYGERGEVDGEHLLAVGREDAYAVAWGHSESKQRCGHSVGVGVKLSPAD